MRILHALAFNFMQLFYTTEVLSSSLVLTEQDSNHCSRVLRMRPGDLIHVTNGLGDIYTGTIETLHDKKTLVHIQQTQVMEPLPYTLHLYCGILKNADRLEWMLEKCVEMGISSFTPVVTQRSEKKNVRTDRLRGIVLSAMKQSLKAWLPQVNEPMPFAQAITLQNTAAQYIGHCIGHEKRTPLSLALGKQNEICMYIGPEGDFTPEEVKLALDKGIQPISLGHSRLRTETAGLVACSTVYMHYASQE